jgi:hypothetical protein
MAAAPGVAEPQLKLGYNKRVNSANALPEVRQSQLLQYSAPIARKRRVAAPVYVEMRNIRCTPRVDAIQSRVMTSVSHSSANRSICGQEERNIPEAGDEEFVQGQVIKYVPQSYKDALRRQFVSAAESYCGTSYSQLDCCGLVRECVHSLPQFGFRLDRCDQGVMYDSLQEHSIQQREMRPGDLIFYASSFVDQEKAPKRHGMVHIEIYLGPDEQSIGSRSAGWSYEEPSMSREPGKRSGTKRSGVGIYKTFKCVSKKWRRPTHKFCSIEPWLEGTCKLPANFTRKRNQRLGI